MSGHWRRDLTELEAGVAAAGRLLEYALRSDREANRIARENSEVCDHRDAIGQSLRAAAHLLARLGCPGGVDVRTFAGLSYVRPFRCEVGTPKTCDESMRARCWLQCVDAPPEVVP